MTRSFTVFGITFGPGRCWLAIRPASGGYRWHDLRGSVEVSVEGDRETYLQAAEFVYHSQTGVVAEITTGPDGGVVSVNFLSQSRPPAPMPTIGD